MKRYLRAFRKMPVIKIVQFMAALLLTVATIVSVPVSAWYHHQRQVAEIQRIRTPDLLYVSAAAAEDVKYFDMSVINIGDKDSDPSAQLFPFAIAGEYARSFTLQIAHTTNNPFVYKVYEGEILCKNGDGAICKSKTEAMVEINRRNGLEGAPQINFETDVVEYVAKASWNKIASINRENVYNIYTGDKIYIVKGNCIKNGTSTEYLNAQESDGRIIADGTYHEETYQDYSVVNRFAEPLYWQKRNIKSVYDDSGWGAKPFFKPFLLELSWDRSKISNKETDLVYISVFRDE